MQPPAPAAAAPQAATPPAPGTPAAPAAAAAKMWREVWPNGKPKALCPMAKDPATGRWAKHGKWESWHEDGTLAKTGTYIYDKMDGEWKIWFPGVSTPYVEIWQNGVKKPG